MEATVCRDDAEEEKKEDDLRLHNESRTVSCNANRQPLSKEMGVKPTRTKHKPTIKMKTKSSSPSLVHSPVQRVALGVGCLVQIVCLYLMVPVFFGLYVSTHLAEKYFEEILVPAIDLMKWNSDRAEYELTYFHRACDERDQSTHDGADLLITSDMTTEEATNAMLKHGASMYPNLLSEETATELREFILRQNAKNEEMINVIQNKNRWSFYLKVDQNPLVSKALREITTTNPQLIAALERVAGHDPAIIELTTITAAYGAAKQHWHQDVVPQSNGAKYARNFIPSYSLFIPLQNTTGSMGATGICPGSTMCADGCAQFCDKTGFQVSEATPEGIWPVGWGALINQQTTHLGEAHTDPKAPHRVVLVITFAPRPQFGDKQVETRMIGLGGSYSLHWSQWGHTLRDYSDPLAHMSQPWRTLRSLGLYKDSGAAWGWDYITVALQRLTNEDVGFYYGELHDFVENGGFPFLPSYLQGKLPEEGVEHAPTGWVYLIRSTLERCIEATSWAYLGYVFFALFIIVLFGAASPTPLKRMISLGSRMLVVHLVIVALAWWVLGKAYNASFARNVLRGIQFRVPEHEFAGQVAMPASLPFKEDIFIHSKMKSPYMESFQSILDVANPGNDVWRRHLSERSQGYHQLTKELQDDLCRGIIQEMRSDGRRILAENVESNWAEVGTHYGMWFCHKELLSKSSSTIGAVSTFIDQALSEIRYGYWRESVMQQIFISEQLIRLQDKILGRSRDRTTKRQPVTSTGGPFQIRSISVLPKAEISVSSSLPMKEMLPKEPYLGAWLAEGDAVEAYYDGDQREWYKGVIAYASANRYKWTVEFEDGDVDVAMCPRCVRPFVPYHLGEPIDVRISSRGFASGVLSAIYDDSGTYDVELDDGETMTDVPASALRRIDLLHSSRVRFKRGDRVVAMFPGVDNEWFPGVIDRRNSDNTYAIEYDDGDFAHRIKAKDIRLETKYR